MGLVKKGSSPPLPPFLLTTPDILSMLFIYILTEKRWLYINLDFKVLKSLIKLYSNKIVLSPQDVWS